jgi:hypothetical protein
MPASPFWAAKPEKAMGAMPTVSIALVYAFEGGIKLSRPLVGGDVSGGKKMLGDRGGGQRMGKSEGQILGRV